MSNAWLNAAMDDARAKNGARLMLFVLADRADDGGISYYGIAELARRTNLGERAAHYAISELVALKLLAVEYKKGPNGCNVYRLLSTLQNLHGAKSARCKKARPTLQYLQSDPAISAPNPSGIPQEPSLPASAKPQTVGTGEKVRKSKAVKSVSPADPRFAPVTDGYCTAYLETFGSPYVHSGGRDGKRLKVLLATASPERFPAEQIVRVARAAMKRSREPFAKATKYATSLSGFCEQFNPIRAELNGSLQADYAPKSIDPTSAEITAWLATVPEYAPKRNEWATWDKLPPFAREKFLQHRKTSTK